MINELFNIALSSLLFRIRGDNDIDGDGKGDVPRWIWLLCMGMLAFKNTHDLVITALWLGVFVVIGCLPTKRLLDMTHSGSNPYEAFSIGFLRAAPCILVAWMNPWILILLLHGLVYYFAGKQKWLPPVTLAELIIGGVLGGLI